MNFTSFGSAGLKSQKCFKISIVAKSEGLLLLLVSDAAGGYPLINVVRYVPTPCKGYGFCALFGLKTDIDFAHFAGLESGTVFEVTTGMYERICPFSFK